MNFGSKTSQVAHCVGGTEQAEEYDAIIINLSVGLASASSQSLCSLLSLSTILLDQTLGLCWFLPP